MVNEAMPWNLTVSQLREFLDRCQPGAIVGMRIDRSVVGRLQDIVDKQPESMDMTILLNLKIDSEPGRGVVRLAFLLDPEAP